MKFLLILLYSISFVMAGSFTMKIRKTPAKGLGEKSKLFMDNFHRKKFSNLATVTQPVSEYFNGVYVADITIGTPPQTFSMLLDTTGGLHWIPSTSCNTTGCNTNSPNIPKRKFFDPTKSTTFVGIDATVFGSFGTGTIGQDVLSIAPGLSASGEMFILATSLPDEFQYMPYDGSFGLGWIDSDNPTIEDFLPLLDRPIFTMYYDMNSDSSSTNAGQVTYGALDTQHCSSIVNYVPIKYDSDSAWRFVFRNWGIGRFTDSYQYEAVIDSATSGLIAPPTPYSAIMRQIGAFEGKFGGMVVLCDDIGTLPDIVLTINTVTYRIPATQYILPPDGTGSPNCLVAIGSAPQGYTWYFGDVWIRSYCNIFDYEKKQIGFSEVNRN